MLHPSGMFLRLGESGRRRGSVYAVTDYVCFSQLGKRCQLGELGLGFAPGLVGLGFSQKKTMYIARYSVFTCNITFYIGRRRQERVDGLRRTRMTSPQIILS